LISDQGSSSQHPKNIIGSLLFARNSNQKDHHTLGPRRSCHNFEPSSDDVNKTNTALPCHPLTDMSGVGAWKMLQLHYGPKDMNLWSSAVKRGSHTVDGRNPA